ncbi:MAG: hypothetical protein AMJ38_02780 [Dehalococcoidia bacterium DG_22]|nr:MAG: hypothetical protein AMJ38_02780 [Dehalococcoidia bacterium DG_22]
MSQQKPVVFISHAEFEADLIRKLADYLQEALPDVFFFVSSSDSLEPGAIWTQEIRRALQDARIVLACISRQSVDRPWVLFETGFGAGRGNRVIPLILDDLPFSALTPPLSMFQAVRPDQEQFVKLVESIAKETNTQPDTAGLDRAAASRLVEALEPGGSSPGVYLGDAWNNIRIGWSRYDGDPRTFEAHKGYVSIGRSFTDGFRYPPRDTLMGPWHYFAFRAQRRQEIHVYAILKHVDGSARKLYVSSIVNSWGFTGDPTDEFRVPIPPLAKGRWKVIVVDVRSLEHDFDSPVRGTIGFRVRGPLWLSHMWCVDQLTQIPEEYLEEAVRLSYPG